MKKKMISMVMTLIMVSMLALPVSPSGELPGTVSVQAAAAMTTMAKKRPAAPKIGKFKKTYDSRYDRRPNHGDGMTYTVKWKKVKGAAGYQVKESSQGYPGAKWWSQKVTTKKKSHSISFSSMYKFKVKVRAFKYVKGKKVYGEWSKTTGKTIRY